MNMKPYTFLILSFFISIISLPLKGNDSDSKYWETQKNNYKNECLRKGGAFIANENRCAYPDGFSLSFSNSTSCASESVRNLKIREACSAFRQMKEKAFYKNVIVTGTAVSGAVIWASAKAMESLGKSIMQDSIMDKALGPKLTNIHGYNGLVTYTPMI